MPESQQPSQHPEPQPETAMEDHAWRAGLEPYRAAYATGAVRGVVGCIYCAHTKFRRSRVRLPDLRELLLLRLPMRCLRCNQRQYGYLLTAALALPPKTQGVRLAQGHETWKAWTESETAGSSLQRPMTTSLGTRATKLQPPPHRTAAARPHGGQNWRDDDRQIW